MSKEKQGEKIHDALLYLEDEMIEDVEKLRGVVEKEESEHSSNRGNDIYFDEKALKQRSSRYKSWKKWTALAASVCLLLAGNWIYESYIQSSEGEEKILDTNQEIVLENKTDEAAKDNGEDSIFDGNNRAESAVEETLKENLPEDFSASNLKNGVMIPKMEVSLKNSDDEVASDMLGFFILNGRSYIQYEFQWDYKEKGADFVGDYVGHITGMIDEWTKNDGYVDGAGTYTGDVYEVKGVSPDFMLCMVWDDGSVETFINHNDITLYKGSDLVDDWLDLKDNYDAVALETIIDNKFTFENLKITEEEMKVFDQFLDAFAEGDYVYVKEKMEHPFGGDMDTPDMLDFYFVKENGVLLRFRTLGDGYVSFPWINACVKIDQNIYDEVVKILQQHVK
ncbi:MAG: hypothetical protein IJO60_07805 [Agathobacter sp.]|nr:hypothetical protein [Agathobacter sp.]